MNQSRSMRAYTCRRKFKGQPPNTPSPSQIHSHMRLSSSVRPWTPICSLCTRGPIGHELRITIWFFHLTNLYQDCELTQSRLSRWILSVIKNKVQQLYIDLWADHVLRLPNRLFTCNSLTKLTLALAGNKRWSINLPTDSSSMCLPNLCDLKLHSVCFHDQNLTNNFFSSCPNLKALLLRDVEFLNMNVYIYALNLEDFAVDNCDLDYGYCRWTNSQFNLHAPGLKNFRCNDFMSRDYILDDDLSSLVTADIDMKLEKKDQIPGLYSKLPEDRKGMYVQLMMQFMRALCYVKDLKLSAWFLEVMSRSLDLLEGESTEFYDLTCLRLETWLSVDTMRAIAYLLKISHSIESLFLEINQIKSVSENIEDYPEIEVSDCFLDELEIVEIQGAVGCTNELNLLEVLLKNATFLKKLVIYTSKEDSPDREKRLMQFTKKLLLLPRASSDITIFVF